MGKINLIVIVDLFKGFGSVSHHILLQQLITLKINTIFFESYILNRLQSINLSKETYLNTNQFLSTLRVNFIPTTIHCSGINEIDITHHLWSSEDNLIMYIRW